MVGQFPDHIHGVVCMAKWLAQRDAKLKAAGTVERPSSVRFVKGVVAGAGAARKSRSCFLLGLRCGYSGD